MVMEASEAAQQIISDLLEARTGQQLTENRRWRIATALAGVFRKNNVDNLDQLVCMLDIPAHRTTNNDLATETVEALLNNETYFFRDKQTFEQLKDHILPRLAERNRMKKRISVWCAGCSTGQEVHSLAMIFEDEKDKWRDWNIDILGTDVSHSAIRTARNGLYTQFEVQRGLEIEHMLHHFEETPEGWQIRDHVRAITRFQQHNLLDVPPCHQRFDLVLCRNVLLYFDPETRKRAFQRLSQSITEGGYLILGAGETAIGHCKNFAPYSDCGSVFELKQNLAQPATGIGA